MITLYYQDKTLIDFLCNWDINSDLLCDDNRLYQLNEMWKENEVFSILATKN